MIWITSAIDICKILIPALVKCFCVDDQASSISALLSYRYEFDGSSIPSFYIKLWHRGDLVPLQIQSVMGERNNKLCSTNSTVPPHLDNTEWRLLLTAIRVLEGLQEYSYVNGKTLLIVWNSVWLQSLRRRNTRYKNPQLVAQRCFDASFRPSFPFFTLHDQLFPQQKHLLRVEEMQCADRLICLAWI